MASNLYQVRFTARDTGRPYAGYSSPSLDTSFHDHEADDRCECCGKRLTTVAEYQAGVHKGVCSMLMDGEA